MTEETRSIYRRYIETKSQIDALNRELNSLKNSIIAYHNGNDVICEDGFESKISHCVKENLLKENLKNHFGGIIPQEYTSLSPYDALRVKCIG